MQVGEIQNGKMEIKIRIPIHHYFDAILMVAGMILLPFQGEFPGPEPSSSQNVLGWISAAILLCLLLRTSIRLSYYADIEIPLERILLVGLEAALLLTLPMVLLGHAHELTPRAILATQIAFHGMSWLGDAYAHRTKLTASMKEQ